MEAPKLINESTSVASMSPLMLAAYSVSYILGMTRTHRTRQRMN